MGAVKVTYVTDEGNGEYAALYIDGMLVIDAQTYELTPKVVIETLVECGLLDNILVEETEMYFEDHIEFPAFLKK